MAAGRPTLYKPEYCVDAAKLCLMFGATDKDLAKWFGVDEVTINRWKKEYPEFCLSIKPSKEQYDQQIVRRLAERAMGYSTVETKVASFNGKITDQVDVIKQYPPDPTSIIFWLTNRQRKDWKRGTPLDGGDDEEQNAASLNITFEVAPAVSDIAVTNAKT